MRTIRFAALVAALVAVSSTRAAAQGGLPINLQIGLPQGEFKENVSVAGGFGFAGIFPIATEFGIRAGLDVQIYGNETRRVPLGGGALGLINVDVTTTNAIVGGSIGAQVGLPSDRVKPYVGGMIGFSNFNTQSRVAGENSQDQPFASSTNSSDNAFSKHALVGMYFPMSNGKVLVDLGARYTWNGESVRYLTPGDITEDNDNNVVITPRETRADLLTITLGVTIRFGGGQAR
ncbi:MAG TPA: outer membrane beta-barrel protein [Gemmatimonadaceae bacterium]|nr:outer membrane beta-barrel protein [Gemmatimonadaceae bacterium]HRQ78387.1 outer membrane beta-barrel protein [Gemmatimonadaceae bacterium]